jgi:DNA-binding transcriptional LysR family regulator
MNEITNSKLKISQLQAFVTVAEHGNFSSAALELGLAQSTISHAIATLEDELGIVLLIRGRHGALLTPEGEEILPDAQQILQGLDSIQQKANRAKGLHGGQVRVATVRSIATHVLPEVIAQFHHRFPMVRVVLAEFDRYVEAEQALRDSQVDIGFTSLPTSAEFAARELFRDEFVALLPSHSLDENTPFTWEQLVRYPMIMNHRSYQHNKMVCDHLLKFGYELNIAYEMREDSTIISMVRQGLGATVMARLTAVPIPDELQVRSLPVPLERTVGVITLETSLLSPSVFAFLDVLQEMWR